MSDASNINASDEGSLSAEQQLPRHVAIIMDGNGRWAKKRLLPRFAGHKSGVKSARMAIEVCVKLNIDALTLFAFSSENWKRPRKEVDLLMDLFVSSLREEAASLHKNNIRMRVIGDRQAFSEKLQKRIEEVETLTAENDGMTLTIAANYGGRWDILQAAQRAVAENRTIDEELFTRYLSLSDLPEPDLFIRTGGEHRISNFLLWQLAYTELYFTDTLWPDFDKARFVEAMRDYAGRQRRFGRTSEQVEKG
ncbi:polyprenyl diphosphate synthase [Sulfuriflexus mobilis]|uniref:polyprenyl diphosphate synthase n=1 Tax=Sulfuriflexus mobilis TaxID=1811807 RepID=UPI000F81B5EE|nr:polyprenyl diphosphate synthase [Sulfuriflexus mobilis]